MSDNNETKAAPKMRFDVAPCSTYPPDAGDDSLNNVRRLRAEIRDLERENERLIKGLQAVKKCVCITEARRIIIQILSNVKGDSQP